jgi:dTDP-glucose pyrophosphorylase/CBS domain-containing protein
MKDLLQRHPGIVLRPAATVRDAMDAMTKSLIGFAVVVDEKGKLLGVVNDLDIRRALLRGAEISAPVSKAMNKTPLVIPEGTPPEKIAALFGSKGKTHLPIVDRRGRLSGLAAMSDYMKIPTRYPNRVVVMAGGVGKRLKPLTDNTPKPMLRLGDKPILEHLIEQMASDGFTHFTFTVNYLAEQIQRHFGDGSRWGTHIDYVHEPKPLGTAGALGLLKGDFEEPMIVLNGDILTKVDFAALLDFHRAEKGLATICVKHHEIQVPYGVVEQSRRRLSRFVEKPTQRFLVNAGIYVLDPRVLALLPKRRACDMPEFLNTIRSRRRGGVACFPIQEYWLDIGGPQEFRRAEKEIGGLFDR